MLGKLRPRSIYDVFALLALLVALGGTGAYAANEWTGENIVDGSLTGQDIFNNTISGADITNGSLTGQDVFDNTLAGADITNGSITTADVQNESIWSADIEDRSIESRDIRFEAVGSNEIFDGGLNANDVGEAQFVDFVANIGVVPANGCKYGRVTGVGAQGDHLVLTPSFQETSLNLIYSVEYELLSGEGAQLKVCNPTNANINDATTNFNLLVFQH
jgi:uncharacterized protein YjbI with pentapeptide repeats